MRHFQYHNDCGPTHLCAKARLGSILTPRFLKRGSRDEVSEPEDKEEKRVTNRGYFTFVSLNAEGKVLPIKQIVPETDAERELMGAVGNGAGEVASGLVE